MKKTVFKILIGLAAAAFLVMTFGCEVFGGDGDDEEMQISIDSVEPNFFIYGEQVDIALTGSNFSEDLGGKLINGTQIMDYTGLTILSSTQMTMSFGEARDPVGWWSLLLTNDKKSQEQNFPDAVEIAEYRVIRNPISPLETANLTNIDTVVGYDFSNQEGVAFDAGNADAYLEYDSGSEEVLIKADQGSQMGVYKFPDTFDGLDYVENVPNNGALYDTANTYVISGNQFYSLIDKGSDNQFIVIHVVSVDTGTPDEAYVEFNYMIVEKVAPIN